MLLLQRGWCRSQKGSPARLLFSHFLKKPTSPWITTYRFLTARDRQDTHEETLDLIITDQAVHKLNQLKQQLQQPELTLRVSIDSGGCHGFSYALHLENKTPVSNQDRILEKNGARVILDTATLEMIKGSKIDYVEELMGSKFSIRDNPQVDSRCGCGTSFSMKPD